MGGVGSHKESGDGRVRAARPRRVGGQARRHARASGATDVSGSGACRATATRPTASPRSFRARRAAGRPRCRRASGRVARWFAGRAPVPVRRARHRRRADVGRCRLVMHAGHASARERANRMRTDPLTGDPRSSKHGQLAGYRVEVFVRYVFEPHRPDDRRDTGTPVLDHLPSGPASSPPAVRGPWRPAHLRRLRDDGLRGRRAAHPTTAPGVPPTRASRRPAVRKIVGGEPFTYV